MLILFVKLFFMMKKDNKINLISDERRTHDLLSVAQMLKPLARKMLGKNGFAEIDLLTGWKEIVGEEIAAYTLPKKIVYQRGIKNNGILWVDVPSGACALELQLKEKFVLAKINSYFGYDAVAKLKIVQNAEVPLEETEDVRKEQKLLVSEEEETYINSLCEGLENKDLQKRLMSLGRRVVSANKGSEKNDF